MTERPLGRFLSTPFFQPHGQRLQTTSDSLFDERVLLAASSPPSLEDGQRLLSFIHAASTSPSAPVGVNHVLLPPLVSSRFTPGCDP